MEPPFDKLDAVVSTPSRSIGGHTKNPTNETLSAGGTGHAEVFWRNIDPTVRNHRFCHVGDRYRSAIFYHRAQQRRLAEQSLQALAKSKPFLRPIVTEIVAPGVFTPAEAYHQAY